MQHKIRYANANITDELVSIHLFVWVNSKRVREDFIILIATRFNNFLVILYEAI